MITCQLVQLTQHPRRGAIRRESLASGEILDIGRNPDCHIHLPDHRVAYLHARIARDDFGRLRIESTGDGLIGIDGFIEPAADLALGMRIDIGPFTLTVESLVGQAAELTLIIEQVGDDGTAASAPVAPPTRPGFSQRTLALGLAASLLAFLFVLPLLAHFFPDFETWQAELPVPMTSVLNPAPLSPAHRTFGTKCSTCHQKAFTAVADAACLECHRTPPMHLAEDNLHAGWLAKVRCADCHAAHAGKAGWMQGGLTTCVACHKQQDAPISGITDFSTDHPAFSLTVPAGPANVRVAQDDAAFPVERSGLKFSHEIHLDAGGVSSPNGRTVLDCDDCHRPDATGARFAPLDMKMSCQQSRCHTIRYDEPVRGVLQHGPERDVMRRLREFYLAWLAEDREEMLRECGPLAKGQSPESRLLDCAEKLALRQAADNFFSPGGGKHECLVCHEVVATDRQDTPWKVEAVRRTHVWLPKAAFNHARHDTIGCSECHDKRGSVASEDISMPDITTCRRCHAGPVATTSAVRSTCADCHRFHRFQQLPN